METIFYSETGYLTPWLLVRMNNPQVLHGLITGRNEVLAKVIFSQACVKNSVHRGGYLTRPLRTRQVPPPPDQAGTPPTRQVPPQTRQVHLPPTRQVPPPGPDTPPPDQAGTPPPGTADSGIRSTFGRYASYWNAFLFRFQFSL